MNNNNNNNNYYYYYYYYYYYCQIRTNSNPAFITNLDIVLGFLLLEHKITKALFNTTTKTCISLRWMKMAAVL
jgi:hypothetical protein